MTHWITIALFGIAVASGDDKANRGSDVLQDFSRRVGDYMKIHNTSKAEIHGLRPTSSPQAILDYEQRLGHRIREARAGEAQGNIFTPEITAEFRSLVQATMQSPEGPRIRSSLAGGAPVKMHAPRVGHPYPHAVAIPTTPPSLLLNLPPLPESLQYRIVGPDLVLLDVDANIVVDFIPNIISPQ